MAGPRPQRRQVGAAVLLRPAPMLAAALLALLMLLIAGGISPSVSPLAGVVADPASQNAAVASSDIAGHPASGTGAAPSEPEPEPEGFASEEELMHWALSRSDPAALREMAAAAEAARKAAPDGSDGVAGSEAAEEEAPITLTLPEGLATGAADAATERAVARGRAAELAARQVRRGGAVGTLKFLHLYSPSDP